MQKEIISIGKNTIVNICQARELIYSYKSGVNFFSAISEGNNTQRIIVNKEIFTEEFFRIENRLLERVLKALQENELYIAVIGNYNGLDDRTLDFLYSYNRKKQIFFLENTEEAIFALNN